MTAPNLSLKGAAEMKARLKKLAARFPDIVGAALYQEGQVELTEVKRRTPVDKGALRASERLVGPVRQGRTIYILVVAGGPSASYAIYVHEDPEAFHKVGQWKYIESVILESRAYMGSRVAKRIDLNRALSE